MEASSLPPTFSPRRARLRAEKPLPLARHAAAIQNAVFVNTSVGLGLGNTVSLPGLANLNNVLNA